MSTDQEQLPQSDVFQLKRMENGQLEVSMSRDHTLNELFAFLSSHGILVNGLRNTTNRLEEVFIDLTQEEAAS